MAPNRLKRDFTASRPNEKWVADITFIETGGGWLYLAAVMIEDIRRSVFLPPTRPTGNRFGAYDFAAGESN